MPLHRMTFAWSLVTTAALLVVGCSSNDDAANAFGGPNTGASTGSGGANASAGNGQGGGLMLTSGAAGAPNQSTGSGPIMLPPNFVKTDFGGYALGAALSGDGDADAGTGQQDANGGSCKLI